MHRVANHGTRPHLKKQRASVYSSGFRGWLASLPRLHALPRLPAACRAPRLLCLPPRLPRAVPAAHRASRLKRCLHCLHGRGRVEAKNAFVFASMQLVVVSAASWHHLSACRTPRRHHRAPCARCSLLSKAYSTYIVHILLRLYRLGLRALSTNSPS